MTQRHVDRGPLAWAPVRLEAENVEFVTSCPRTTVETHGPGPRGCGKFYKDSLTRIEQEGRVMGIIIHSRYRLLEAECVIRQYRSRLNTSATTFQRGSLMW